MTIITFTWRKNKNNVQEIKEKIFFLNFIFHYCTYIQIWGEFGQEKV